MYDYLNMVHMMPLSLSFAVDTKKKEILSLSLSLRKGSGLKMPFAFAVDGRA